MDQHFVTVAVNGSVYVIAALGLTLSWGILHIVNLAHGAILTAGGMVLYFISTSVDAPLWLIGVAVFAVGGAIAVCLEFLVYAPIRTRHEKSVSELTTIIGAVAAAALITAAADKALVPESVSLPSGVIEVSTINVLGLSFTNLGLLIVVLAIVLTTCIIALLRGTPAGRLMRAFAHDALVCRLMGASPAKIAGGTMFISGALAGLGGMLLALQFNAVSPVMGDPFLLKSFAIIILGGVGSIGGAVAGAYLLAFVEVVTAVYIDSSLQGAAAFAIIVLVLLIRPQGLLQHGKWERV